MPKILVIDADSSFADQTKTHLEANGHEVTVNTEPGTVIEQIASGEFRLMCLDLTMPGLSGESLLSVLRNLPALDATKVLLYSSTAEADLKAVAEKYDAAWVGKSAPIEDLYSAIDRLLEA